MREASIFSCLLAKLKKRGITVIYVSHRLEEIFRLCDVVNCLARWPHVATESISATESGPYHSTKWV